MQTGGNGPAKEAYLMRAYAYMQANELAGSGSPFLASKQRAAGNIASEVFMAVQSGRRSDLLKALELIRQTTRDLTSEHIERLRAQFGSYGWHTADEDRMKLNIADASNETTIANLSKSDTPLEQLKQYVMEQFNKFNEFISKPGGAKI